MSNLTNNFNPPRTQTLYAYINNKKRKIGYVYKTKNGNLCIKGDKMLDKAQLGRLLVKGLYINVSQ